jgi:chromosome segregation ATPase
MKTKVVLWGENASNEKILVALELLEKENKVNIYTFALDVATEEFYQKMTNEWRVGKPLEFPEHKVIERPLSLSDSLLPDDIKVEKTELITRAQVEWQVVVLSSKLYEMYQGELDEIKEKIEAVSDYDDKLWQETKAFWDKVFDKVKDQTLFREHSNILKERVNNLFDKLKELKKAFQSEIDKGSKEVADVLMSEIADVESKLDKGLGLKPLFEQMKGIQDKYYQAKMSHKDKKSVWDKLDATFKALKEKKPGGGGGHQGGDSGKLQARYAGLIDTIKMMESSIARDRQDYNFQVKKIEQTDGQLEMQIRQAKLKMLEERISSKDAKLQDMYKVRTELEAKIGKEEVKKANEEKTNQAKAVVKQKIATDIEKIMEERETMADLLENAASKIKDSKKEKKQDSLLGAIAQTISETVEDVVDTVKAVAEVVEDRLDEVKDQLEDKAEDVMDKVEAVLDQAEDKIEKTVEALKNDDKVEPAAPTEEVVKEEEKTEEGEEKKEDA